MSVEKLEDRPPYVTFHRTAVENPAMSKQLGRYAAVDVDFVHITPHYTKDVLIKKVTAWLAQLEVDATNSRIPAEWVANYRRQYEAWKNGQELPLEGTPIRGWGVISPAQQETLIRMNIRTVEDAARMNEEAMRMIGMGAQDVKNKAIAALQAATDTGPLVIENAQLKSRVELAETNVEQLTQAVEALQAQLKGLAHAATVQKPVAITADDLIEPEEDLAINDPALSKQYEARFGKMPHHRAKRATIEAQLRA